MSARAISLFVLMACALVARAIPAPQGTKPVKPDNVRFGDPTSIGRNLQDDLYGVIKKIGKNEIILDKTKFGVDQSIRLEPKTKYVRDQKASSLDKLEIGDPVYVNVKTEKKTGVMTAKKVTSGVIAAP
jgi:hypothetical protein